MKNPKICYVEYEMQDGEFITMSTAPILLLKLRGKDKKAYGRMSKMLMSGGDDEDVMGVYQFLYDAYLCANQDEEALLTFTEFIENVNADFVYSGKMMNEMVSPSKKQDSEQPSEQP